MASCSSAPSDIPVPVVPVLLSYVLSFVLRRHLLEQSSPSLARVRARFRTDLVAKAASSFLAFACALRDQMGRRELQRPWPTVLYGLRRLFAGVEFQSDLLQTFVLGLNCGVQAIRQ